MTREELRKLLRAAQIHESDLQILIVGSQSILGTYSEGDLPERATLSMEADVMYLRRGVFDQDLTDVVDAYFGEGSAFHAEHGVYLQGVDDTTCVLPARWRERLVSVPPQDGLAVPVLCLEPHDLAVAKLAAGRPKDVEFVHALLVSGQLQPLTVRERAGELDAVAHPGARGDVLRRVAALSKAL